MIESFDCPVAEIEYEELEAPRCMAYVLAKMPYDSMPMVAAVQCGRPQHDDDEHDFENIPEAVDWDTEVRWPRVKPVKVERSVWHCSLCKVVEESPNLNPPTHERCNPFLPRKHQWERQMCKCGHPATHLTTDLLSVDTNDDFREVCDYCGGAA